MIKPPRHRRTRKSRDRGQAQEKSSQPGDGSQRTVEGTAADATGATGMPGPGAELINARSKRRMQGDAPLDPEAIGAGVATILETAHEVASRIRSEAEKEASRARAEAESAAEAAIAEASRSAEDERAVADRVRTEAEAYARDTRAAADAYLEESRKNAQREASQLRREEQKRLEAIEAEVERKVLDAEERSRERLDALQDETTRYEKRLESMLEVFRAVCSRFEELLRRRTEEGGDGPDAPLEGLEDVLPPGPSRSVAP
jgi:vacuolar-type H+-ATPase subunit E/Vma4